MTISVVINTKDSARTLPYALRSVATLADEVVVVDMESSDPTPDIARAHGAEVVTIPTRQIADVTRTFAISRTRGDWVLMLDGDEFVSPMLADTLKSMAHVGAHDAVRIPMVNYLLGAPARFGSWSPHHDRHWRFFRRDALIWPGQIHTMPQLAEGKVGHELPYQPGLALVHLSYVDTSDYLARLDRYTSLEADRLANRPWSPTRGAVAALREVVVRFLLRQGFRDGWRGVHLTLLMVIYRLVSHVRAWERRCVGTREEVEQRYADAAERWLRGDVDAW